MNVDGLYSRCPALATEEMSGDFLSQHGENAMSDDPLDGPSRPDDADAPLGGRAGGLQAVLAADFAEHGRDVVKALRLERPHDYLKLVASFAPKDPPLASPTIEDMTDDEFMRVLNALRSYAPAGGPAPDANGA
jgi:hypothetical protein